MLIIIKFSNYLNCDDFHQLRSCYKELAANLFPYKTWLRSVQVMLINLKLSMFAYFYFGIFFTNTYLLWTNDLTDRLANNKTKKYFYKYIIIYY